MQRIRCVEYMHKCKAKMLNASSIAHATLSTFAARR